MKRENFLSVLRKMEIIGLRYVMPRDLENKYQLWMEVATKLGKLCKK
jgi:hypothetical protein